MAVFTSVSCLPTMLFELLAGALGFTPTATSPAALNAPALYAHGKWAAPAVCMQTADLPVVLTCGRCKATYHIDVEQIGGGRQVRCSNCAHEWFQSSSRLHSLPADMELIDYPAEMKERIAAGKSAEPRPRFRAFVGNLGFTATEQVGWEGRMGYDTVLVVLAHPSSEQYL